MSGQTTDSGPRLPTVPPQPAAPMARVVTNRQAQRDSERIDMPRRCAAMRPPRSGSSVMGRRGVARRRGGNRDRTWKIDVYAGLRRRLSDETGAHEDDDGNDTEALRTTTRRR